MDWVVGVVYAGFLAGSGALGVIDARTQKLPNKIMFPLYGWGVAGLALASWVGDAWWRMAIALGAAALCYGLFWLLWFFGGMGFGDVKLLGVLGLYLGWAGVQLVFDGLLLGMLVATVISVGRMAVGNLKWKSELAYGPYLIVGSWGALGLHALTLR